MQSEESENSAVDPAALAAIFGDDAASTKNILQKFVGQSEEIAADFETAFGQRDAAQVKFQAHKFKSSARTVGANKLADLCLALEVAGGEDNWLEIDRLAEALRPELERVKNYIAML